MSKIAKATASPTTDHRLHPLCDQTEGPWKLLYRDKNILRSHISLFGWNDLRLLFVTKLCLILYTHCSIFLRMDIVLSYKFFGHLFSKTMLSVKDAPWQSILAIISTWVLYKDLVRCPQGMCNIYPGHKRAHWAHSLLGKVTCVFVAFLDYLLPL